MMARAGESPIGEIASRETMKQSEGHDRTILSTPIESAFSYNELATCARETHCVPPTASPTKAFPSIMKRDARTNLPRIQLVYLDHHCCMPDVDHGSVRELGTADPGDSNCAVNGNNIQNDV